MSANALPLPASSVHGKGSRVSGLKLLASETRFEFIRLFRTRTFSLSTIGFPVMFYVLFGLVLNRDAHIGPVSVARYLLAGYAVFGAVGTALFGVGVSLAADFSAGWLELKRASPMPVLTYLLAKCATALAFGVVIVCLLTGLGMAFGHVSLTLADFGRMVLLTLLGTIPFTAMGLVIALLVPFNSAPGVTNLVYLPMSFLGGLWMPLGGLPVFVQHLAKGLPTYHVAQLMLRALGAPSRGTVLGHAIYLLLFTAVLVRLAAFLFHRRENNG